MSHENPGWAYGYIPTPAEWNEQFGLKQDWNTALDALIALNAGQIIANPGSGVGTVTLGDAFAFSGSVLNVPDLAVTTGIVPHAGGGQADATQLSVGWNVFSNPATNLDSVALPDAVAPAKVFLMCADSGGWTNVLGIYAKDGSTDTINGQATATLFDALSASPYSPLMVTAICAVDGAWLMNVGPD